MFEWQLYRSRLGALVAVSVLCGCAAHSPAVPVISTGSSLARNVATSNTWTTEAPMPIKRHFFGAASLNGIFYAIGGWQKAGGLTLRVDAYNPATNSWTGAAPLPEGRRYGLESAVAGDRVYAIGGVDCCSELLRSVYAYDPVTNTWTERAKMPYGTFLGSAAAVNGIVYVIGGTVDTPGNGLVSAYDPSTNTWSAKASIPGASWGFGAAAIGNLIYVVGSDDALNGPGRNFAVYDTTSDTWTTLAPIPVPLAEPGVVAVNGTLYVVSGNRQGPRFYRSVLTLWAYDPSTKKWTKKAPPPRADDGDVAVVNGVIYSAGGQHDRKSVNDLFAYTP